MTDISFRALPALAVLALVMLVDVPGRAQEQRRLLNLEGDWLLELGDDPAWASKGFDDSGWATVHVPSPWEEQGYPGYDGFAWYRKHFRLEADVSDKVLFLRLGRIDDVDEVYVNGHFIGFSGSFPPDYMTAYGTDRVYFVPSWCVVRGGDNVIAVRVFDSQLAGGITAGPQGLYEEVGGLLADEALDGLWKFAPGDDMAWKEPGLDDSSWKRVYVPAPWETQGFRGYDGYGWYRTAFRVPPAMQQQTLIMLVGRVDDYEETYLNGVLIGHTGKWPVRITHDISDRSTYKVLRAYTIPPGVLRADGLNVLAVRVADNFLHGGIYQGPLGLITRDHYLEWSKTQRAKRPWPLKFFDYFGR